MSKQNQLLASKFHFEEEARHLGYRIIAGVDEAGRGPIAGPLLVSACILPLDLSFQDINDSKKLSPQKRDILYEKLISHSEVIFSLEEISESVIDEINILQATLLGMQRAVKKLSILPDYILVDGNRAPDFSIPAKPIIQGDALSFSIGAASILAKVTRDRLMEMYHAKWPEYGFLEHKGYPTQKHKEALRRHGPCPIHRKSYAPVKLYMN